MAIKSRNIFQSKALQHLPKLGFLVWKQTIWQPWGWPDERVKMIAKNGSPNPFSVKI
jgi:hypothetical protein